MVIPRTRESFKSYSGQIFGRELNNFRGIRTGQGNHFQDHTFSRRQLNIDCREGILRTRAGQTRRNQIEDGALNSVHVLDTVKVYSISSNVYIAEVDELFNNNLTQSQFATSFGTLSTGNVALEAEGGGGLLLEDEGVLIVE